MKNYEFSNDGIEFLKEVEGIELREYPDVEGNPTIGIGHLLTRSELSSGKISIYSKDDNCTQVIRYSKGITEKQAFDLLLQDLRFSIDVVNLYVEVDIFQHQFDCLVSFAFNVGNDAFITSTLLKKLNSRLFDEVPAQLRRWNKCRVNGTLFVNQGLVNRREKEILLWYNNWSF